MTDTFTCLTSEDNASWTKRTVVSHISQVFYPCGFPAPFIIVGKIFMEDLERIKIPRHINTEKILQVRNRCQRSQALQI